MKINEKQGNYIQEVEQSEQYLHIKKKIHVSYFSLVLPRILNYTVHICVCVSCTCAHMGVHGGSSEKYC
jgi:hypothetical protein